MSSLSANKSLPPNIWYLARDWARPGGGYTCTCTCTPQPSVSIANMFMEVICSINRAKEIIYANLWNIYSKKSLGGATRNNPNEWSLVTWSGNKCPHCPPFSLIWCHPMAYLYYCWKHCIVWPKCILLFMNVGFVTYSCTSDSKRCCDVAARDTWHVTMLREQECNHHHFLFTVIVPTRGRRPGNTGPRGTCWAGLVWIWMACATISIYHF